MGRRPRFEPLPMCPDCVPREDILAPGIGFDLTTSYATAAIRYHDGTVENLVKVGAPFWTSAGEIAKSIPIRSTGAMSIGSQCFVYRIRYLNQIGKFVTLSRSS